MGRASGGIFRKAREEEEERGSRRLTILRTGDVYGRDGEKMERGKGERKRELSRINNYCYSVMTDVGHGKTR